MIVEAWFAVAVMVGVSSDGMQDLLVFRQPKHGHFHSSIECQTFVNENPLPLIQTMVKFYGQRPVERILCVREDRLKNFINEQKSVDS